MKPTWGDLTKVRTRKKEGSRTRIVRETSCNQILVRFLLAKSPTTGLSPVRWPSALEVIKDVGAKVTAELLKPFLGGG
jgi:hypothetical protein